MVGQAPAVGTRGDEREVAVAHDALVNRFIRLRPQVAAYVRSLMSTHEDAADLLQELSLALLVRGDAPAEPTELLRWCRGAARNLALHHWRSARRHSEIFAERRGDAHDADAPEASSLERAVADRDAIERCLRCLDEHSRRLLVMRYVAGKTSAEIARRSHQSPAAVRMKLMRVREDLRRCLLKSRT